MLCALDATGEIVMHKAMAATRDFNTGRHEDRKAGRGLCVMIFSLTSGFG
jgi:hypothetical protein